MYVFKVSFADTIIEIRCRYKRTMDYCEKYAISSDPDFKVNITDKDIDFEKDVMKGLGENVSDEFAEILALHRLVSESLVDHNVLLMHGSAISLDGNAVIFTAPSGTGKSTHSKIWKKIFNDRVEYINDDKPFLKFVDEGIYVFGSPWNGKHKLGKNTHAPLKAIVWIKRGDINSIKKLDDPFELLLTQVYRPEDRFALLKMLDLMGRLIDDIPFYELYCNMEDEAAMVSYQGIFGEQI